MAETTISYRETDTKHVRLSSLLGVPAPLRWKVGAFSRVPMPLISSGAVKAFLGAVTIRRKWRLMVSIMFGYFDDVSSSQLGGVCFEHYTSLLRVASPSRLPTLRAGIKAIAMVAVFGSPRCSVPLYF